jgi:hypothetical protein
MAMKQLKGKLSAQQQIQEHVSCSPYYVYTRGSRKTVNTKHFYIFVLKYHIQVSLHFLDILCS